jgi:hypothetical protein
MALAAAAVGPQPQTCLSPPCSGVTSCTTTTGAQDAVFVNLIDDGGPCIVWAYKTTGTGATKAVSGHVYVDATNNCYCPISTDPTWD